MSDQPDDRLSPEHRFAERAFLAGYRQCAEDVKPRIDELQAKVDWYRKAERLLIWDGAEWHVRHDAPKEGR